MRRIAWRVVFFVLTALVVWLSVKAPGDTPGLPIWDKLQHFLAYAVLGASGALGFPTRASAIVLALGLVLLGGGLEVVQLYLPEREMSLGDGVANLLGVICGTAVGYLVTRR